MSESDAPRAAEHATNTTAQSRESASKNTHAVVFELLRKHRDGGTVVDLPCGSGAFLKRLAGTPYTPIGADIMRHAALPPVEFRAADMDAPLPFADASVDAVVSIEGIEHIRRPFDYVRELRRILKPDGVLILTTPNVSSLRSRWRWFLTGYHNKCKYPLDESAPQPRHHINMLPFPKLRYMLHTSGLRIEQVATGNIKAVSWLYLAWLPLLYPVTRFELGRSVRGQRHAEITREVTRQMFSKALLLGETMIVVARPASEHDVTGE